MTVASDGSGDFRTIQAAIDNSPLSPSEPTPIRIAPGVYREKVQVPSSRVRLLGEDAQTTKLVWGDHALKTFPDGRPYGTFASYTLQVTGDDFFAEGLTVENDAGDGRVVGQAVAVAVDADRAVFRHCHFRGHQDTLFTGPLPPHPLTAPTFGTPRELLPRRPTRQYFADCTIEGDVDFIFGSATAVFERCEIHSLDRGEPINGWITAASTPEGLAHGYVFFDCRLTSPSAPGSVYLGRPWRNFAKTIFVRCWLGDHIHPDGWHDWEKASARTSVLYAQGQCRGPGAGRSARWALCWGDDEVPDLSATSVLGGQDGWNPDRASGEGRA